MANKKITEFPATSSDKPCLNCITLPMCIGKNDPLNIARCPLVASLFYCKAKETDIYNGLVVSLVSFPNFKFLFSKQKEGMGIVKMGVITLDTTGEDNYQRTTIYIDLEEGLVHI